MDSKLKFECDTVVILQIHQTTYGIVPGTTGAAVQAIVKIVAFFAPIDIVSDT